MNWDLIAKYLPTIFEVLASGIIFVLHRSGADRHKTVAGEIAQGLDQAARVVVAVHKELLNGAQPPQETPGGGS